MNHTQHFAGELIGTFLLVLFGCGSVAVTVLYGAHQGLFQVAMIWGIGVSLAIYVTRHLSCAHLNPAVSLAMVVGRRMSLGQLPPYLAGQVIGAFLAALVLYLLFGESIAAYETLHHITRGAPESVQTAMIFGEFYPNPGAGAAAVVSTGTAFLAEAFGTAILVFLIFSLTEGCNLGRPDDVLVPLFIGLAVTILICILAPLTQAGMNPARDLVPRLFAYAAGWRRAAMPDAGFGFLTVYVLGPVTGAIGAALAFVHVIEPLMSARKPQACCREAEPPVPAE